MTLNELANEIINHRGYLVICTRMTFPTLPYSLARGLCTQKDGEPLDSASLYAYEVTNFADYLEQQALALGMGHPPMINADETYNFYRVRND